MILGGPFESINPIADAWASWMWSMSWHVSLLVLMIWVIQLALKNSSSRLKHWLWLIVVLRLVVPPTWASPTGIAWWVSEPITSAIVGASASAKNLIATESTSLAPSSELPPSKVGNELAADAIGLSESGEAIETQTSLSLNAILMLVWFGILVAWACLFVRAFFQVRQWIRKAEVIDDPRVLQILKGAKDRSGVYGYVELRDCASCATPLVTGWVRPTVLLPTAVHDSMTDAELESVLVHELTHVRRHDVLVRQLEIMLLGVYFFHPAVWIANMFIQRTREDAVDEQTVSALSGQRKPYATAIVKATSNLVYEPPHMALGMLDPHPTKDRIARILDPSLPIGQGGTLVRASVVVLVAALLLPMGAPAVTEQAMGDGLSLSRSDISVSNPDELLTIAERQRAERDASLLPKMEADTSADQGKSEDVSETGESADGMTADGAAVIPNADLNSNQTTRVELAFVKQLSSVEFEKRLAAYKALETLGTEASYDMLMNAFLERSGAEQYAAKKALEAVRRRLSRSAESLPPSVNSVRVHEAIIE